MGGGFLWGVVTALTRHYGAMKKKEKEREKEGGGGEEKREIPAVV